MSRDNVNTSTVHERRTYYDDGSQGQTFYDSQKTKMSIRDDATSTYKVGNAYVLPTTYMASFTTTSVKGGRSHEAHHYWPYQGKWGGTRVVADGARTDLWPGAPLWGINPTSLRPRIPESVLNGARAAIHSKLADGAWNANSFLAEIQSTVDMLRDPLSAVHDAITKWRAGKGAQAAANSTLYYNFGLKPLMADIYGLLKTIEDRFNSETGAVLTAKVVHLDNDFGPPDASDIYFGYDPIVEGTARRGVEISVTYTVDDPVRFQLWRHGLTNPLSFFWERLPLSFVVDWFFHVGNFLRTLESPGGLSFAHGYELVFLSNAFRVKYHLISKTEDTFFHKTYENVPCEVFVRSKAGDRLRLYTFPTARPYFSPGFNTGKVVSSAALAAQRMRL